jgi:hypothetical protein
MPAAAAMAESWSESDGLAASGAQVKVDLCQIPPHKKLIGFVGLQILWTIPPMRSLPLLSFIAAIWITGIHGFCQEVARFSFEKDEIPFKWKSSVSPGNPDMVGVSTGQEGVDSHTGESALQYFSPKGGAVIQANWLPVSPVMSFESQAGTYACSFWVKMHGLPPGAHLWLRISSENNAPFAGREDKDDIRSPYISPKTQPEDEWVPVEFEFTVASGEAGQLFRPHFILKGNPSGTENEFSPEARVLIDDLVISRK